MEHFTVGLVTKYFVADKYGFLRDETDNSYFFLFTNVINNEKLNIGDKVSFMGFKGINGLNAKHISKIASKKSTESEHLTLIKRIDSEWRLEGLNENNAKLFYYIEEIDQIVSGRKYFVIGRKGTGKTAIAEYLYHLSDFETYTEKLSFKSFPIKDLYDKGDTKFSLQNQYITIWKYIIYGSLLKMMSSNEKIEPNLLKNLRKLFPLDPVDTLERRIKNLTELEFSISLAGNSLKTTSKDSENKKENTFLEKAQLFEDILTNYIDDSKYYIIIDALDDDYSDINNKEKYFNLLNGLFKAVQEVKALFPQHRFKIYPVVFLRDDIYRQINDSDKTKWRDYIIRLYWRKEKIKKMLAHRIFKTININHTSDDFDLAWQKIFPFKSLSVSGKKHNVFDFIYDNSYIRPRDFIIFLKLCCERAINHKSEIDEVITFKTIDSFSKYLLDDIEYEIKPIMPEIEEIISILRLMRKEVFSFQEFDTRFNNSIQKGNIKTDKSSEKIMTELYNFNVIENLTNRGIVIYKMYDPKNLFNLDEQIIIKTGLQFALRI